MSFRATVSNVLLSLPEGVISDDFRAAAFADADRMKDATLELFDVIYEGSIMSHLSSAQTWLQIVVNDIIAGDVDSAQRAARHLMECVNAAVEVYNSTL